ncbi:MAG: YSIRK-type signal peptide-containing protein, partial [Bifidobacteriaceae bacterium]|nr:YSIRK-type signal peptide-containing protein [Bifidobacteriaceae bacterium]
KVKELQANQKQRFGLRKLSVGVASVLLGTAFFIGATVDVHADNLTTTASAADATSTTNDNDADKSATTDNDADKAVSADTTSADSTKSTDTTSATSEDTSADSTKGADTTNNDATKTATADTTATDDSNTTVTLDVTKATSAPVALNALTTNLAATNATTDKQTNVNFLVNGKTQDTVTVGLDSSIQLNFQTNDYNDGDKFIFKIYPDETPDFAITGSFNITPANDKPNSATVSSVQSNTNEYEFSDTMHGSGTYNQVIAIGTTSYRLPKQIMKDGSYKINVDVYKQTADGTQALVKQNYFTINVSHSQYIYWDPFLNQSSMDSTKAVYTLDGNPVTTGVILSNTDYEWRLRFSMYPQFSPGSTVTIPVPDNFVLDVAATQSRNASDWEKYPGSVKQEGNKVIFTYDKLTNEQYTKRYYSSYDTIHPIIVGKINQTFENTTKVQGDSQVILSYGEKRDTVSPFTVYVLGSANTVDKTPVGQLFTGQIHSDKINKMHTYYPEQPEEITTEEDSKTGAHPLNNAITLTSTAAETINGVDATVVVPDGMNISKITLNGTQPQKPTYYYEYTDGTRSADFTNDNILTAPDGKYVKKVHIHLDSVGPYQTLFNINLFGVLADTYRGDGDSTATSNTGATVTSGEKLADYDTLTTQLQVTLADSKTNPVHGDTGIWAHSQNVLVQNPDTTIHLNKSYAVGSQSNMQAGQAGGTIKIEPYDFQNATPDTTYYVVLPTNAYLDPDNPYTGMPSNAKVSYMNVNGINVVKIVINGGTREDYAKKYITLNLDNSTLVTNQNLQSGYAIYQVSPAGQKQYYYYSDTNTMSPQSTYSSVSLGGKSYKTLPFVENNTNAFSLYSGSWNLVSSVVTTITTESQGNQNSDFGPAGKSDDKGDDTIRFSSSLVNGDPNPMKGVTDIIQMPNTSDGKSEFDFQLGKQVKVYDVTTNTDITSQAKIYYTTKEDYKTKKMSEIDSTNWKSEFSETAPEDLSTVTAVAVELPDIPTQHLFRIIVEGTEPNFKNDAGKTAYVANKIWGDTLLPKNIELGKTYTTSDTSVSAKLTIVGDSTIHVNMNYTDPDGTVHTIENYDVVLHDNVDKLTKTNVLTSVFGTDPDTLSKYGVTPDTINSLNDNPDFRAQLIKKYPGLSDYAVDFTKLNGPDSSTLPKGDWDQTVKYYFDGNTVSLTLTKLEHYTDTVTINRDTKFVSNADGTTLETNDTENGLGTKSTNVTYDPLTDHYTVDQSGDKLQYSNYTPTAQIGNYKIDSTDTTLAGPTADDINKVLSDNGNTLFDKTNKNGYTVDMTKKSDGTYDVQLTSNPELAAGAVNIIFHQVAHYNPIYTVTTSRDTSYVSNKTGEEVQADKTQNGLSTSSLNTTYDQTSHALTSKTNLPTTVNYGTQSTDVISGYTLDSADQTLTGPQQADLQKVLNDNQAQLFDGSATTGFTVTVTKDANGSYTSSVEANSALPAHTISVVYKETAHYNPNVEVTVSRETRYVNDYDGSTLQAPTVNNNFSSATLTTQYDQNTHEVKYVSNVPSSFTYPTLSAPQFEGLKVIDDGQDLRGPKTEDIQNIITANQATLFNANNTSGYRLEITRNFDSSFTPKLILDPSIEAGKVSVVFIDIAHYNPIETIHFSKETKYVSNATGKEIKNATQDTFHSAPFSAEYDADTHEFKSVYFAGQTGVDDFQYSSENSPAIDGYKVQSSDETLDGLTGMDVMLLLVKHQNELYAQSNTTGMRVDFSKDGDGFTSTVTADPTLKKGEVTFVYHQVAHYNPIYTVTTSRNTDRVSDKSGENLAETEAENNTASASLDTVYDATTHQMTSHDALPANIQYADKAVQDNISGYTLNTADYALHGPQNSDLASIIDANKDQLFAGDATTGFTLTVTKGDNGYTGTVTANNNLSAHTIAIVYNETAHFNPTAQVTVSQEIQYVSNETGKAVHDSDNNADFNKATINTEYDAQSHTIKTIGSVPEDFDYQNVDAPTVAGYTVDDADKTLTGLQDTDIQKILDDNKDTLFAADATHGYKVDVTKDAEGTYKTVVSEDTDLQPGQVSIVLHQVAHYNPQVTVNVSRETSYVSSKTGQPVQDKTTSSDFNTTTVDTTYDQTSNEFKSMTDLPSTLNYPDTTSPAVPGYDVDTNDQTLKGLTSEQIQKILTDNQSKIFNGSTDNGKRVDVNSDGSVTVTEDESLAPHTISVVYHETAHYNPVSSVEISQVVDYVSNATGKNIADETDEPNIATTNLPTTYGSDQSLTGIGTVPESFHYNDVQPSATLPGYTLDDNDKTIAGMTDGDIQKILDDNKATLFASDATHGYKIDVTKDAEGNYTTKLTEDDTLPAGKV